ncbi:MAG: PASTA domain-containing protein [Hamadaea sp.]|uniref:PASTA domain-containing protein n=1 Tax=Hamadaea sp. TaxID=2024425 RepID=UPI0017A4090A|nr:PASTA domain-containing protein [Hamadaea sp.]NUR71940.1 PASTA domain-containing protein [Hamadaea sp.]NUT22857.1 PASTA domain-containing protein [Hamadaea sp.]
MTDPWATRVDAEPPRQGISPAMIAAIATSVAVLAIVGATGGYLLANSNPSASPSTSASVATSSSADSSPSAAESPSFSPTPVVSATSTTPAPSGLLPDGSGRDFREYFAQLRAAKLGVLLIFGESGQAGLVTRTSPSAGSRIRAGVTIKVYVAGEAPPTELPKVVGLACRDARVPLGDKGLLPTYMSGQTGVVLSQSPDPDQGGTARWNDHVEITCGESATTSPSP